VIVPLAFYMVLSAAFYSDLAVNAFDGFFLSLQILQFWVWLLICPLSVLFILQFADFSKPLPLSYCSILCILPIGFMAAWGLQNAFESDSCISGKAFCMPLDVWMLLSGFLSGTLCLPFVWLKDNLLKDIRSHPSGHERYWMILALLGLNFVLLGAIFLVLTGRIGPSQFETIRTLIGLMFVYISATCLFRIYPAPAAALTVQKNNKPQLNAEETLILEKIRHKMEVEKVYFESSYSRSDLAREVEASESIVSRFINAHYNKSFPVLLNEYRVKEAQRLLRETDAPIKVIAEEVGFNSLPSFNRVFKDMTGQTASEHRKLASQTVA
jgi:AraC-like DNA-binding protein